MCTLVVPLSILSNWETQIKDHCHKDAITYHVYYGAGRSMDIDKLKKYDVVITTYQVVTKEHDNMIKNGTHAGSQVSSKRPKKDLGVFGVQWKVSIPLQPSQIPLTFARRELFWTKVIPFETQRLRWQRQSVPWKLKDVGF